MKTFAIVYFCLVTAMSLITFLMYGWDKRQARKDNLRIPEARLHLFALLGGWPGALVGRQYFRHKTQKLGFTIKTWGIVAIHVAALAGVIYFFWSSSLPAIQSQSPLQTRPIMRPETTSSVTVGRSDEKLNQTASIYGLLDSATIA